MGPYLGPHQPFGTQCRCCGGEVHVRADLKDRGELAPVVRGRPWYRCRSPTSESPGVRSANLLTNGRGVASEHATEMTVGLGANVTVLDNIVTVVDRIWRRFGNTLELLHADASRKIAEVLEASRY